MTARFSVKNSHIEDDLIFVFKMQTPTVKVITVRLRFVLYLLVFFSLNSIRRVPEILRPILQQR